MRLAHFLWAWVAHARRMVRAGEILHPLPRFQTRMAAARQQALALLLAIPATALSSEPACRSREGMGHGTRQGMCTTAENMTVHDDGVGSRSMHQLGSEGKSSLGRQR